MIKFLLEGYDNMMSVSTIDKEAGKIQITIAPDLLEDAKGILADLGNKFYMQALDEDPSKSQGQY